MITQISVAFRSPFQKVTSLLPPDLAYMASGIKNHEVNSNEPPVTSSYHAVGVTQKTIDRLIEWGRERVNGASIIRIITIDDCFELSDVEEDEAVEIFVRFDEMDDSGALGNYYEALSAYWQCPYCQRVTWKQTDDLEVDLLPHIDYQRSDYTYDWIVSRRTRSLLQGSGISFRPLKSDLEFSQMLIANICKVSVDVPPVQLFEPCPVCHRPQGVSRNDILEGMLAPLEPYHDITVVRRQPLTIEWPFQHPILAGADVEFGGYYGYASEPSHVVGQQVDLSRESIQKTYPYILSACENAVVW